ncbi:short chain dehydrogenase [Tsukamurella pulmonis]|nr:SDR family oxidoreductase [Tsukamurella pulmonis]KXO94931.1 short-chain dehydrogenase [Tsukamurella pulmonis]KXP12954.1 short-chain dehydrogenase [Tsukamurella pulmonis]RDH13549.1 SDR family oxidoreductase [Tsukamurella pulmonis]BDD81134.1 short chain dehydrogenase [Tsukamurella pulmonis]
MRILITGASSGLGEGMARTYAERGEDVGLLARRLDRLEGLRAELSSCPKAGAVEIGRLDVTDFAAVPVAIADVVERLGGLDRAIINAGIGKGAPLGTGKAHANLETVQTNLTGALAQAEAVLEVFRAQGRGHLVLISSIAGQRGMPKAQAAYSASKAGLTALGEGLQAEFAGSDITVTVIKPGFIETDINKGVKTSMKSSLDDGVKALVKAIDREPKEAAVPSWPWTPLGAVLRHAPDELTRRLI